MVPPARLPVVGNRRRSFRGVTQRIFERQEMSEEFSQLEATLTEAARQGNIAHVIALLRDTGRLHHLWQVHTCPSISALDFL